MAFERAIRSYTKATERFRSVAFGFGSERRRYNWRPGSEYASGLSVPSQKRWLVCVSISATCLFGSARCSRSTSRAAGVSITANNSLNAFRSAGVGVSITGLIAQTASSPNLTRASWAKCRSCLIAPPKPATVASPWASRSGLMARESPSSTSASSRRWKPPN
jgi:hypothetical protein